jgi:hypothetical protein
MMKLKINYIILNSTILSNALEENYKEMHLCSQQLEDAPWP